MLLRTKCRTPDKTGDAFIYLSNSEHTLSVTVNKNLLPENQFVFKTKIETITLDNFIELNNISNIDLIKIDVETHEPMVLEGFTKNLAKFRPVFLIEILSDDIGKSVEQYFKNLNYIYYNIDEINNKIVEQKSITKSFYFNYILCPKEKQDIIKINR